MNAQVPLMILLFPGLGMILISFASILIWRRVAGVALNWSGVGALLWVVAVALKFLAGWLINSSAIGQLKAALPYPCFIAATGLYIGLESSAFEIGATWIAARM